MDGSCNYRGDWKRFFLFCGTKPVKLSATDAGTESADLPNNHTGRYLTTHGSALTSTGNSLLLWKTLVLGIAGILLFLTPVQKLHAQTDCLSCHGDTTMQDAAGHNVGVNGDTFKASVHGGLACKDCHTNIKAYPHPDKVEPVKCVACHADEVANSAGSVHASVPGHTCASCHGDIHAVFPKGDPKSNVYPLNVPRTCGTCHGDANVSKQHSMTNVYPAYMDSIHGFALSKEGLLVSANCTSCHGSHHILSHNDPQSPTNKANIPATCGTCHAGVVTDYMAGVHGKAIAAGNMKAPVCTDCHTAHAISQPSTALSTPLCGSCHADKLTTYRDTFHSHVSSLGTYVEVARCSDCHGSHEILPASDPRSPIAPQNLITTCGKCHQGANASFVQYQPHANPHNRHQSPILWFIQFAMGMLLLGTMSFFVLHTVLWFIRSEVERAKRGSAKGEKDV